MSRMFDRWARSTVSLKQGYRSCYGKSSYKTAEIAEQYKAKAETARPHTKLRIYSCEICHEYHLTKKVL